MKHRTRRLVIATGLLACAAREAAAQAAEQGESWRFAFTPYAWISGIRGTIGMGSSTGEVDVAFNEGGEDFEFGFAGLLEARRRRWVARTDFFYVSFSSDQATSAGTPVTPLALCATSYATGQSVAFFHGQPDITEWARAQKYFASEDDLAAFSDDLKHLLVYQKAAFNSPVWFNVGFEKHPQCSACFINAVQDTMESILGLAKTEGMLFKYGSGTG